MFGFFKKTKNKKIHYNYPVPDIGYIQKIRNKNGQFVKGHHAYYDPSMRRNKKGQFVKGKRNVRFGK